MRDYAELVKALRICGNRDSDCEGCPLRGKYYYNDCAFAVDVNAADAIEELDAAVQKWVSVEERLPEKYESVITANKNGDVCWNYLINEKYGTWSNGYHITHWMPLPASPGGAE